MRHFFHRFQRLHFVGILGTGMCGIAELMLRHGFTVTGSDLVESDVADRLRDLGAAVWIGHRPEHVHSAEVVIYSTACQPDNEELVEARRLQLPVIPRAEMLGELMRLQLGIAVAGVHGKSTTTSMLGAVLQAAGLDPTVIVGGRLQSAGSNAMLGESEWLVAEADEFDRSFLHLNPVHAIVTNLEHEHVDTYPEYREMEDAFVQFCNSVPFYGAVVICGDDPGVMALRPRFKRSVVTYGIAETNDVHAVQLAFSPDATRALIREYSVELGELRLGIPGIHNLRNALATIAMARQIGVSFDIAASALREFCGVARRFEFVGQYHGARLVDDYAHHPTEVAATISAARIVHSGRLVALFQPHLYSRTAAFSERFALALAIADVVVVMNVYAAREQPQGGVTSRLITDAMRRNGHPAVYDVASEDAAAALRKILRAGDMCIAIGAGDVVKVTRELRAEDGATS